LVALVSLIWLPTGRIIPPVHNNPLLSRGLADFWGRRWNLWFSRWFRMMIFNPMRSRPKVALFTAFLVSGIMHEFVVNLPLYLVTGRNLFGSMMIYFLIQAPAVLFENKFLKHRPVARGGLLWMMVVGPVPLLLNEGMLRVLQLWR
jgi:D-alanyl-lipoteichoic acid acyltransferase DltB (MBOAT superfamily)